MDNTAFYKLKRDFSQKSVAKNYSLKFIKFQADLGLVDINMDMQRQYVWTSSQEQELIDSLLLNVRIPEFHSLIEGDKWRVCDGRQRFTCTFNFLENKIPFLKSSARKELKFLFPEKVNKLYFKDFLPEIQSDILNTDITVATYSNLTREEQILLFRKINNGTALSNLAKGLSSYYYMRTDYSYFILDLPCFKNSKFTSVNQEDLECAIIRMLILISKDSPIDLQQQYLEKYYSDFENINYIVSQREKVISVFERIKNLNIILNNQGWRTGLPFLIYGIYKHPELTTQQIDNLLTTFTDKFKAGRGNDLGATGVQNRINYIENLISQVS